MYNWRPWILLRPSKTLINISVFLYDETYVGTLEQNINIADVKIN